MHNRRMPNTLKFAANLSFLFGELPFTERFAAAAEAGFEAVEFHFPYEYDKAALAEVMLTSGVHAVLFNLPAGRWEAGERGIACHPDRIAEFRAGVERAIDFAKALDVPRLNCLAGIPPADANPDDCRAVLVANLSFAAKRLASEGIGLLLEPLNTRDTPGFMISTTHAGLDIIDAVGSPNLRLQYDVYHAQVMEGDIANTLRQHLPRIGHIQIADNPGRHEPGTGEINYPFIFRQLQQLGYSGWIGCEYVPSAASGQSFGWLPSE